MSLRRWAIRGLAVLVVPLGLLALAEGVVRALGVAPTTEVRSPLPFQEQGAPFRTLRPNEWVWPGDFPRSGPVGKPGLRIVVVGSSAAAGDGYTPFISFAGRLEAALRLLHPARAVEVVSIAVGGVASRHVVGQVNVALLARPDLVIVYTGNNEYHEIRALKHAWPGYSPEAQLIRARWGRSHLYRLLRDQLTPMALPPTTLPAGLGLSDLHTRVDGPDRELVRLLYAESMRRMVAAGRAAGVPVMLTTVATNLSTHPDREAAPLSAEAQALLRDLGDALREKDLERAVTIGEHPALSGELGTASVGRLLLDAGFAQAALPFLEAAEAQVGRPNRSDHTLRAIVRDVAIETGTPWCDTASAMVKASISGVPGADLFDDACHPNPRGHQVLGEAMLGCLIGIPGLEPKVVPTDSLLAEANHPDPDRLDRWLDARDLSVRTAMPSAAPPPAEAGSPEAVAAQVLQGHLAFRARRFTEAKTAYLAAEQMLGPDAPRPRRAAMQVNVALVEVHLGNLDAAKSALEAAKLIDPSDESIVAHRLALGP